VKTCHTKTTTAESLQALFYFIRKTISTESKTLQFLAAMLFAFTD